MRIREGGEQKAGTQINAQPGPHFTSTQKGTEKAHLQIPLNSLPTSNDIRQDLRAFAQRELEHLGVGELGENVGDVMEVGQD